MRFSRTRLSDKLHPNVGNLSYQTTEEELNQLFSSYGEIKYTRVIENKGFGFVELETTEGDEKAMNELNGMN